MGSSDIAQDYLDQMEAEGYELEWRQGSRQSKKMGPKDVRELRQVVRLEEEQANSESIMIHFFD